MEVLLLHKVTKHAVDVPPGETFGGLKVRIAPICGVPAEHQKLLFRGRERHDKDVLEACGVKAGSKIHVAESSEFKEQKARALEAEEQAAALRASEERRQEAMMKGVLDIKGEIDAAHKEFQLEKGEAGSVLQKKRFLELLTQKLLQLDDLSVTGKCPWLLIVCSLATAWAVF
eukprot:evm.model.scf_122.16 EVM.evm.TU.scf_122.16   scf_122:128490-131793(-)